MKPGDDIVHLDDLLAVPVAAWSLSLSLYKCAVSTV